MSVMNDRDSLTSPFYKAPGRHGSRGTLLIRNIGGRILLLVLLCWVCTEYVAARLAFQPALGEPMLAIGRWNLYSPTDWLGWYVRWHAVAAPAAQGAFRAAGWASLLGCVAI